MKSRRIELIDAAKAITIFLVILGHTAGNFDRPLYRLVLYSFHMPLFFFLAGMSIKIKPLTSLKEWKNFIRKNIFALVVPYLIWGLIYAPFSFKNIAGLLYGSYIEITRIGSLTSLWYLTCLFSARIIVQALISILGIMGVKSFEKWCVVLAVILFAVGLNIPAREGGYLWNVEVAFTAGGFILLGMALRLPVLILAQQKNFVLALTFCASLILFYAGTIARADSLDLCIMANSMYGNIFWFFYNSTFGSVLILAISMIIARFAHESPHPFSLNFMTYYIGQHTLGIYLLHKNFLWEIAMPFAKNLMPGYPELVPALVGSVIAFVFAAVMCLIIERFVPQLLGQFPKYEN
ncbi:MAG: acyltransferase family protein [Synergistaceae bacterium]|nr:acyltransferase family protein [Synergistaceae bacterium]